VYGDRDLIAPLRHTERVVTAASAGQTSSLLNTMQGIENIHAANWLENSHNLASFDSLVSSIGSMNIQHGNSTMEQQHGSVPYLAQGFALPANLDEYEHINQRSDV